MAANMRDGGERRGISWRIIGWGTAALLLLIPFIANAPWTVSDFVFAGVLIGGVGLAFEFIVRRSGSRTYRFGAAFALLAAFITVWVNAAVGMIGSEDHPYNLLFGGVLAVALIGAIVARLEPAGLARAMIAAAVAQAALGAVGLSTDVRGGVFSMVLAAPWLLAAFLFWNAARERTHSGAA